MWKLLRNAPKNLPSQICQSLASKRPGSNTKSLPAAKAFAATTMILTYLPVAAFVSSEPKARKRRGRFRTDVPKLTPQEGEGKKAASKSRFTRNRRLAKRASRSDQSCAVGGAPFDEHKAGGAFTKGEKEGLATPYANTFLRNGREAWGTAK